VSLSRIAGDEFAFVLGTLNISYKEARKKAIEYAQRISDKFSSEITIDGRCYNISVSIGISIFSVMQSKVKDIIQEADVALYEAKRLGRNQFYFFEQNFLLTLNQNKNQSQFAQITKKFQDSLISYKNIALHLYFSLRFQL